MNKRVQIFGMAEYYIPVIFDILKDNNNTDHLDIFLNIESEKLPYSPVYNFSYSINRTEIAPNRSIPAIFGVSGFKNKYPVYRDFLENYSFAKEQYETIIHYSSYVAASASIGRGCFIEQNVIISSQTSIGFGVSIKRGVSVGHHCVIDDFIDINPGVVISGKVRVGKGVTLGVGSTVLDGVSIGANSFIGAGSVVTKDIPSGVVAYGSPCKVIRENTEWNV